MNIRNIDLNLLVVFEALLIERNVSRAAARLGLSQPAVSNALSRLRKVFGDPILTRARSGMIPTSRAIQLAKSVSEALRHIESALTGGQHFDPAQAKNTFTLAATDYVEWVLLPNLCGKISREAPEVRLESVPLKERIPYRDLEDGQIDLAIGYFTDAPGSLYQQTLFTDDFVCVMKADHPAAKEKLSLQRFASLKHALVAPWKGMVGVADEILARHGLKREIRVSTSHFLVAPNLVAQTDCIGILPRQVANLFSAPLSLRLLELPFKLPTFSFAQIWHERTHSEPAHRWLRSQIADLAGSR